MTRQGEKKSPPVLRRNQNPSCEDKDVSNGEERGSGWVGGGDRTAKFFLHFLYVSPLPVNLIVRQGGRQPSAETIPPRQRSLRGAAPQP